MEHHHHTQSTDGPATFNNLLALKATLHCLSGCAIGEMLGLLIGSALGWSNFGTVALAVVLAFLSGYAFTLIPLLNAGMGWRMAAGTALAADTASIAVMELVDNLTMLLIPGAMEAPPDTAMFWISLLASLFLAGLAAFPLNRWLIGRGRGHALAHGHHH
ncbi:DUF4396 domain-containing protein [Methyloterricola oryzae]|uniref:DUF4396 domain-containing protein n=1 Tax=Methyloterricola oryzae TaxID=1495050 RepID=UPI0005EB1622|nr:DUF4396 domain-containing protein [Methyloterricola oryzae]